MAKSNAVWGIDIGQCALKALRCVPGDETDQVVADAFDFIEYPKILSQPEADPIELVRDALRQFLSRNKVRGDRVAVSVPGQSGLARFIKLPPVESKKIPDIVKYEARQQIPFPLEDVVWDYQQMAGGSEEEGFALETEVGLFAMKRDQAYRALRPFTEAGIEVDIVQLTPLAIYNFVVFDQLNELPPADKYDPENPPPSIIVLSLGTDTTDLVITNGYRVWQRNIPLGGNHFTKALTKELKLTFAKAEHLKRNALKAEDPKAVFLAMRPVFNDLLAEVQRSISFFQSVDRTAKIGRVITLGNAMKLRGLQKFLAQSLGYEVIELNEYRGLGGSSVVGTPAFKDNLLSFGVCYGLALQGLNGAKLHTNLIPRELLQDRLIRAKKPWAVAAVATLLFGLCVGFFGYWRAWDSAGGRDFSNPNSEFKQALSRADDVASHAKTFAANYDQTKQEYGRVIEIGDRLRSVGDRRLLWPELMRVMDECLPTDPKDYPRPTPDLDRDKNRDLLLKSRRIEIDKLDCEYFTKLEDWFTPEVQAKWLEGEPSEAKAAPQPGAAAPATAGAPPGAAGAAPGADAAAATAGPKGPGWVIQITGHHFHNADPNNEGTEYVRNTLMKNLETSGIVFPSEDGKSDKRVTTKELGIGYPLLIHYTRPTEVEIPIPGGRGVGHADAEDAAGKAAAKEDMIKILRSDFILQFCWKETPPSKRTDKQNGEAGKPPAALAAGIR